jgi:predicted nuclease of predicted toxin-antitoxin system
VLTARDAGQLHAKDAEQLAYAVSQSRTLVTHNRTDFEELIQSYFDAGQMHYGVIFAVRRSPQEIAQRLLAILNQVTSDEMQNQVRYIE